MKLDSSVNGIFLEFRSDGKWIINVLGDEMPIAINNTKVMLSLLPYLEMGRDDIEKLLINENELKSFPFDKIIEAGFMHGSEGWCTYAMEWLSFEDDSILKSYKDYLEKILSNKGEYGQKTRHKAKSLLKRAEGVTG